jgi:hypothetical protein
MKAEADCRQLSRGGPKAFVRQIYLQEISHETNQQVGFDSMCMLHICGMGPAERLERVPQARHAAQESV